MNKDSIGKNKPGGSVSQQIDRALASGEQFGMLLLPGENEPRWFGKGYGSGMMTMEVAPWLAPFASRLVIGDGDTATTTTAAGTHPMPVYRHSTSHAEYINGVEGVIGSCSKRSGKTVYSRAICGHIDPSTTPGRIARSLFEAHPNSLRFIYHTPQTGSWLGATPEILLDFDKTTGEFRTMALAGTRKKAGNSPWDEKNIRENRFVIDFITDSLSRLGITAEVAPLEEVAYGEIEHLCAHIHGTANPGQLPDIMDALNPTPALCGYPKTDAINDLRKFEAHPRGCYGGFVAFSSPRFYKAFVNLRCMQFDTSRYCIYGGGGITPQSVPDEEWAETEAKTTFLQQLANGCHIEKQIR